MNYISVPSDIRSETVASKSYSFSASQYKEVIIKNKRTVLLRDLLDRNLKPTDKGIEVGSQNYISNSPYQFIRTKALQPDSYLPSFSPETVIPILPSSFKNFSLKEGNLLISKDSNIGEVIILDQDYPNHMISGGIYKLPISKHKYFIFALLKSEFFRNQLLFLVSRGATIKHAKTIFLDCKIPLPSQTNELEVIEYIENLVRKVIDNEKSIQRNFNTINELIERELKNQKSSMYKYAFPTNKTINSIKRLDTGIYTEEFQKIDFFIRNYKEGFSTIDPNKIKSGNTPTNRVIGVNKGISNLWITPTNISHFGTLISEEFINSKNNNLNTNAMLVVNRTSRGGRGEYVGVSMFFDLSLYGHAQHNQGIYRISGYSDIDLLFMTCFMNCRYLRQYSAGLSVGSKMKELKISQLLSIPFPNFPNDIKGQIASIYMDSIYAHEETKLIKRKLDIIINDLVSGNSIEIID